MVDSETDAERPASHEYFALGLILVSAAVLRFAQIGTESLWSDELATVHQIQFSPLSAAFWVELRNDVHPPAYYTLLRLWSAVFGVGEVALRAPSALAGIAFCGALWAFVRKYLGTAVALTAAGLSAVSPLLVQYSHEARSYALLSLITTWVAYAWLELVESRNLARSPWFSAALAGVAAALAAYVHYSGLIVAGVIVLIVGAYAVMRRRDTVRSLLLAMAVAAALYAPWVPSLLDDLARGGLTFLKPPSLAAVIRYPLYVLPGIAWIVIGSFAAVTSLLPHAHKRSEQATLGAFTIAADATKPRVRWFLAFLAAWLVLTLAVFFVKSRVSTPIFNVRNLIVVAPPILVLGAWAIVSCARGWTAGRIACTVLVAGICAYHLVFESSFYGHRSQEQFREASQCAIAFARQNPGAVVVALTYDDYFDYYLRQLGSDLTIRKSVSRSSRLVEAAREAWDAGTDQVVVIWAHIPLKQDDRKRILKDRKLAGEEKLKKAGCMLLVRR